MQAAAFDQLHGDVEQAIVFACVVDHHDVGVGQPAGGASFRLKTMEQVLVRHSGGLRVEADGLDGDRAADHRVLGAVDNTHGATAEFVR